MIYFRVVWKRYRLFFIWIDFLCGGIFLKGFFSHLIMMNSGEAGVVKNEESWYLVRLIKEILTVYSSHVRNAHAKISLDEQVI